MSLPDSVEVRLSFSEAKAIIKTQMDFNVAIELLRDLESFVGWEANVPELKSRLEAFLEKHPRSIDDWNSPKAKKLMIRLCNELTIEQLYVACKIILYIRGGLDPDGVSKWFDVGSPSYLERIKRGDFDAVWNDVQNNFGDMLCT